MISAADLCVLTFPGRQNTDCSVTMASTTCRSVWNSGRRAMSMPTCRGGQTGHGGWPRVAERGHASAKINLFEGKNRNITLVSSQPHLSFQWDIFQVLEFSVGVGPVEVVLGCPPTAGRGQRTEMRVRSRSCAMVASAGIVGTRYVLQQKNVIKIHRIRQNSLKVRDPHRPTATSMTFVQLAAALLEKSPSGFLKNKKITAALFAAIFCIHDQTLFWRI